MEIVNCAECGRVFRPIGGRRMCPECLRVDQERFAAVRNYLKKHPGADIAAVSDATGVSIKRIQEYLREGRLVLAESVSWLKCERCGSPITTGRLCTDCARAMQRSVGAAPAQPRPSRLQPSDPPATPSAPSPYRGSGKKVVRDKFRRR